MLLLVILLLIFFYLRVYFYELSNGNRNLNILMSILRRIYSFKYFVPISVYYTDDKKISKYKKLANICLYVFFLVFLVFLIFSALNKK